MRNKTLKIVLIILLPLILCLYSFNLFLYNDGFYNSEFEKNGVYDRFGKDYVLDYKDNMFNYLQSKEELNTSYFNEKERTHMVDVKSLINYTEYIYYSASALFLLIFGYLFFVKKSKKYWDVFLYGGILSIILILLLGVLSFINFDFLFTLFHKALFSNLLWLMDPSKDNMIIMFPLNFFYDFVLRTILMLVGLSLVLIASGFYLKKKSLK